MGDQPEEYEVVFSTTEYSYTGRHPVRLRVLQSWIERRLEELSDEQRASAYVEFGNTTRVWALKP